MSRDGQVGDGTIGFDEYGYPLFLTAPSDVLGLSPKPTPTPTPTKQPAPGDTDGDGCSDQRENGPSASMGGQRDYRNPYDYFNPTHDGMNRADDIIEVVDQYFIDAGNPAYREDTDRTFLGPNPWNLGPPDGKQRAADVIHIVKQYFHDCA